ncbi:MAG: hypothetical protein P8P83_01670 [Rickettsiaceae bacterium]|nr:hypothetical protein [Rickettsiaceae bacterium]
MLKFPKISSILKKFTNKTNNDYKVIPTDGIIESDSDLDSDSIIRSFGDKGLSFSSGFSFSSRFSFSEKVSEGLLKQFFDEKTMHLFEKTNKVFDNSSENSNQLLGENEDSPDIE